MSLGPDTVDKLIWTLVFGGLLLLSLGFFLQRRHEPLGWTLVVFGSVAAAVGAALIWVRSRMK